MVPPRSRAAASGPPERESDVSGPEPKKSPEKRHERRAKSRLLVRFGTIATDRTGFTKNISDTGLFVHTNRIYPPGTSLQLVVQFPDRTFSFWARVAWAKAVPPQLSHLLECGMGVKFINPEPEWFAYYKNWKKRLGLPSD
jgi:hypothetical protein